MKTHFSDDIFYEISLILENNEKADGDCFIKKFNKKLVHDPNESQWYIFKGNFWEKDKYGIAFRGVDSVAEEYRDLIQVGYNELENNVTDKAEKKENEKMLDQLQKQIEKIQTKRRRENILHFAHSGDASLGINGDEWDSQPWVLPCKNGLIDLKTGELRKSIPEDYIRTVSQIEWHGLETPAENWEKFLTEIFDEDKEMVSFVQRLLGSSLVGEPVEHIIPVFYGQGRNGKSTLFEIIRHVLGELSGPIPADTIMEQSFHRSGSAPSPDILRLQGRRIAWTSETEEGRGFNMGKVKMLSGGDTLSARPLYGRFPVEFTPSHSLFVLTNHKPRCGDDYALFQRLIPVEFKLSFVDDPKERFERPRDPKLLEKLLAEGSGILAWLVRGCLEWQKRGLDVPEEVQNARREYQAEEDIIAHFVEDECDIGEDYDVQARPLYDRYNQWCKDNGFKPLSRTNFGRKLGKRYEKFKSGSVRYLGLKLAP